MIAEASPKPRKARRGDAQRARALALLCALASGCSLFGKGDAGPPELCLEIEASARLNLTDGEPHALVVYLFPLENATAFDETDARDLLAVADGGKLVGLSGPVLDVTLLPAEVRRVRERFQDRTVAVGLVADFYGGPRKAVLDPVCNEKKPRRLLLLADDVQTDAGAAAR
jgi:type VI secretion system VasD/TssJ family lipoprotein